MRQLVSRDGRLGAMRWTVIMTTFSGFSRLLCPSANVRASVVCACVWCVSVRLAVCLYAGVYHSVSLYVCVCRYVCLYVSVCALLAVCRLCCALIHRPSTHTLPARCAAAAAAVTEALQLTARDHGVDGGGDDGGDDDDGCIGSDDGCDGGDDNYEAPPCSAVLRE